MRLGRTDAGRRSLLILRGCLLSFTLLGCARQLPVPGQTQQPTAEAAHPVASADSLAAARRYQEAAGQYAAALALEPDSLTWARRALGVFWRAARYAEAYTWGIRVLEQDPDSRQVLFNVGVTCGFLVELECMESMFHRALHTDPTYVLAHGELAFLAYGRGDLPAAIHHMERGHAVAPADELAASGLAQMLIPAGALLSKQYDFVACSEVVEHAYDPAGMFTLFGRLLAGDGVLGVMTRFYDIDAPFSEWWYRRDPTHVCFYSETTMQWIAAHHGWSLDVPRQDVTLFTLPRTADHGRDMLHR